MPATDLLVLPALALLVGYVVPVYLVANNLSEFQHLDLRVTLVGLLTAGSGAALLAWLLSHALSRRAAMSPLFGLFRFAFLACLLTGLLLPLTEGGGQLEPTEIPLNVGNAAIAAGLAAALTLATRTRLRGAVTALAVTILLGNGLTSTWLAWRGITRKETSSLYRLSQSRNVFVLSFDGLPRDAALEVLREDEPLAAAFADFILFTRVMSSAPATTASVMSELAGVRNLKRDYPEEELLLAGLTGSSLLTNALDENGFEVSTYGAYSDSFADASRAFALGTLAGMPTMLTRVDETVRIFEYAVARTASSRAVVGGSLARRLAARIWSDDGDRRSAERELYARTAGHQGRGWDLGNSHTALDLERYISGIHVGLQQPAAHFLHFTHTHYPVDFDETCAYRSDDSVWFRASQNRAGAKAETACALRQYGRFLAALRRLGLYESSLVVLKSDHGKPVAYNDPQRYEGFSVRGHALWGFGRYTPLLAIKVPGAERRSVLFDDRPVSLSDLAYSLCQATIAADFDCTRFAGFDLLQPAAGIPDDAGYPVYLVTGPDSNWLLDTHEAVELPRNVELFAALNGRLTSELLRAAPPCDRRIGVEAGVPYNNGATDQGTWVRWRQGRRLHLKTRLPACGVAEMGVAVKLGAGAKIDTESARLLLDGSPPVRLAARSWETREARRIVWFELPGGAADFSELSFEIDRAAASEASLEAMIFRSEPGPRW